MASVSSAASLRPCKPATHAAQGVRLCAVRPSQPRRRLPAVGSAAGSGNLSNVSKCQAFGSSRSDGVVPAGKVASLRKPGFHEPVCSDGGSGGPRGRGPHPPSGSGGSGPGGSGDFSDGSGRGRMKPLTIGFGLFVLVGGVMGYKKKRSKDSLIASSIIAGLLLFSAYLMGKPNTTYGIRLALVTTGSLAAYMGKGYYDKRKVFPQGVLAVLSTLMTIAYVGAL